MSGSGWSVRLFEANEYDDEFTIDHMDNFTKGKNRQLDSLRTYSGMYGVDNYLIWNLHKNLPNYDFSTVALDLNLFMYKNTDICYFQDFYRVQDIRYNPNKSQYTLYAVSETTVRLHTKLVNYKITSLSYKENRTAKQLLKETIEAKNIFYLRFHDDALSTKSNIHYQYRYFDIDPEWTVLDLIQYIADDNQYEWCVTTFVDEETNHPYFFLHIGHELKPDKRMNATKKFNIEDDNISDSVYTTKITTNGSPMQPLAHWEEKLKCLWSKHSAGKGGGISKGCFAPIGMGHFNKSLYLKTLEGDLERDIGYSMLTRSKRRFPSVGIGNILKDEGDPQVIDAVSIQKNPKTYSIREPHNILINRGDDELLVQHQLEQITRSTPYLDHEAGLLFPSSRLEENKSPPSSIVFNIDGKRESAVAGPFIMGDGRIDRDEDGKPTGDPKLILPLKENKGDLRLQLPNGWCFYIKEDGSTYLRVKNVDSQTKPSGLVDGPEQDKDVWIKLGASPGGEDIKMNSPESIILKAVNDIELYSTQTINLDGQTIIHIGANANSVLIAGGGHKLSRDTHKHGYQHTHAAGNLGIPIPPQSHIGSGIDTDATTDNTVITEAD